MMRVGGYAMKRSILVFGFLVSASVASAQQMATVQMQCHDLATSGNFVASDEVLVDGMACKQVRQNAAPKQNLAPVSNTTVIPPVAVSAAPVASQPAPEPVAPVTAESMKIRPGATVYVAPMDGFESYMAAALGKKKVQLIPVVDAAHADYIISGTSVDKKAGWAKIVFMGNIHSDNAASITMTDKKSGAIVYAYAVDKKSTTHGQQTTAEACAKHLKSHMEGHD
jgi:hypothetical protein